MTLLYLVLTILLQATQQPAQAPPPDTEIFLARLSTSAGALKIEQPVNITNSPGYDNQPSFTPDGRSVLFTSSRGGSQTDIYRYDIATREVKRLTDTPESEYSPTVTPDGKHFSVIRVEADSTQRLWRFTLDGRNPQMVLTDVKPVGYHAWADDHTLALFVLGSPATLQLADTKTGKAEIVAKGIGRSIQPVPGRGTITFVLMPNETRKSPEICELDPRTKQVSTLLTAVPGAAEPYVVWTPDGMLLTASAGKLYGWRRGDREWHQVADLQAFGLNGVSRLAVSPKGDFIAIVVGR